MNHFGTFLRVSTSCPFNDIKRTTFVTQHCMADIKIVLFAVLSPIYGVIHSGYVLGELPHMASVCLGIEDNEGGTNTVTIATFK